MSGVIKCRKVYDIALSGVSNFGRNADNACTLCQLVRASLCNDCAPENLVRGRCVCLHWRPGFAVVTARWLQVTLMFRPVGVVCPAFLMAGVAGIAASPSCGSIRSRRCGAQKKSLPEQISKLDGHKTKPELLALQRRAEQERAGEGEEGEKARRLSTSSRKLTSTQRQKSGWRQLSRKCKTNGQAARELLIKREEDSESARAILDDARCRVKPGHDLGSDTATYHQRFHLPATFRANRSCLVAPAPASQHTVVVNTLGGTPAWSSVTTGDSQL